MENGRGAVLIEVRRNHEGSGLPELRLLAETAGYFVRNEFEQTRLIDAAYCLGKGRAKEIAVQIREIKPSKIIFNNALKPNQKYNLTKLFMSEVIDRFQLILEIFTKRAGTLEAKYQIELAKLQYELPMARENVRFAKLGELPGFHGLGKYQVDVYITMIKRRISYLKKRLNEISTQKSIRRRNRRKEAFFTIALTGYTFAGKTTLFNSVANETLPVGSNLFTTLSTTTRGVTIGNRKLLLSDTVGFIDNLPHLLVEAFYSTLEEVTLADLILLVMDASDPFPEFVRKFETCVSTLNTIGVFRGSIVPVLNKIDIAIELPAIRNEVSRILGTPPLEVSAKSGQGMTQLMNFVSSRLPAYESIKVKMPASEDISPIISRLSGQMEVKTTKCSGDVVQMEILVRPSYLPWLRKALLGVKGVQIMHITEAKLRKG